MGETVEVGGWRMKDLIELSCSSILVMYPIRSALEVHGAETLCGGGG